ncbi:MAG: hypothetical protein LIO65_02140 [Odoribacter sp.]|nr:hypothetical protein [Odoribacter sp.]
MPKEFLAAASLLPTTQEKKGFDKSIITSKQIPSKGTAYSLLAHLLAFKGGLNNEHELFSQAIVYCDSVIEGGG